MKYLCFVISFLLLTLDSSAQILESSQLPIIKIFTANQEIPDEPKITSFCEIINNENSINHINDPATDYEGFLGIEIRGQSSAFFPKKSYGIEFRDELGEDLDVEVLGFPEESDFVLHGPFSDKSLIRNALAYSLAAEMNLYSPRFTFVELVINEEYKGVYLFVEKIKRDKNRVDISKLNEDELSGEDVEGGYIIKFDKADTQEEILWESQFNLESSNDKYAEFLAVYPKAHKIQDAQVDYIKSYVDSFEMALNSDDYTYASKHYTEFIDEDSFVDYILFSEFVKNIDAYRISTYFHKDKGGELVIGPVWDYNLAFGNANFCLGGESDGWQYDFNYICPWDIWLNHFWWRRFLEDPAFKEKMEERYLELRKSILKVSSFNNRVDFLVNSIGQDAIDRNFKKYDVIGEQNWPNNFVGETYQDEVDYIKRWFKERIDYMDENLYDELTIIDSELKPFIFPNPSYDYVVLNLGKYQLRAKTYEIYNAQGILIYKNAIEKGEEQFITFDGNQGIYFLRLLNYDGKPLGQFQKIIRY